MITMECTNARSLILSYLDGELSEAQAGPLRKHLLGCQACRGAAQGEKNLKRWFVEDEPLAIPRDFAARVARRAFAGDTGERFGRGETAAIAPARDTSDLRFVLWVTSVAAVFLIFLSIAIGKLNLPAGGKLMADDHPEVNLDRALEDLERLNAKEAHATVVPVSSATTSTAPVEHRDDGANPGDRKR